MSITTTVVTRQQSACFSIAPCLDGQGCALLSMSHPDTADVENRTDGQELVLDVANTTIDAVVESALASLSTSTEQTTSNENEKIVWVPARLHPTIAPHEFKSWLEEHSSAVNLNETMLGRRRSILSLHSYSKRASVSMDQDVIGPVKEEEAAAASASFHDVADDMSTYDESTSTLKAVLKRRFSLNSEISINLYHRSYKRGGSPSTSNRASMRRSVRSRIYRTGSTGTAGGRSAVLSRRGAHRRFTSSTNDQLGADGDKTDGDSPPNSSVPPQEERASLDALPNTPPPIPIMEPHARLNYMQDKEFKVLDRPYSLGAQKSLPEEPIPSKRSMDAISINERRHTALSNVQHSVVRSTRSSDNMLAAFRKDSSLVRAHTTSIGGGNDVSNEEKRSTKKASAWSWLWGGDSQVEAETARMRKRNIPTPIIDTSIASENDSGSEGRPSIELGQPNIEMSGVSSFFFSSSRSKQKQQQNTSGRGNDDANGNGLSSASISPASPATPNQTLLDGMSATGDSANARSTLPPMRYTNYNRFPIHIERAIYRLSHVKLSNPRRALNEQVLISNMMFWYLSLISQQTGMNASTEPSAQDGRVARETAAVKSRVAKGAGGRKKKSSNKRQAPAAPLLGQEFTTPAYNGYRSSASASPSASEDDDDDDDEDDVPLARIRHSPIPAS
ncbi:hypothetical protein BDF19DRAFT_452985 [Syncephalis fuscata]|nr:hypothetical protein BDF19DRAFT_452985 [Syncephalis fuscata]